MNPQEMQGQVTPNMSDDQIAALLGITTTFAQHAHFGMQGQQDQQNPNAQVGDAQQSGPEATPSQVEQQTPGTPKKDEEQDKEIADIRAALEALLAKEDTETNGTKTKDTGTA